MDIPANQTIFSGVQPSGTLHLGNYLGAIKQWVELQQNNTAYYCIVDQHAITVPYEPKDLPERVLSVAALYLAAGIDPNTSVMFVQSHVPAHTEAAWLLSATTPYGELTRMTQFKDKGTKTSSLGLFSYPVLMAADILLYQTHTVPVGEDQTQHIELTRDIGKRFNNQFGKTFTIPKAYIPEHTKRIMSLTDPARKMSKSDGDKSYIAITDEPGTIRKKIMGAVTETEPVFSFTSSEPAVKNLLTIYQAVTGKPAPDIEKEFLGQGYKEFKQTLAEATIKHLTPIRERYSSLRQDDTQLRLTLARGAEKANRTANQTLHSMKKKMGLV